MKPHIRTLIHGIGRYVPVRHRYVFTRNDRLRLRVWAPFIGAGVCFAVAGFVSVVQPHISTGGGQATSIAAYINTDRTSTTMPEERLASSQKRLQRYGDAASAETAAIAEEPADAAPKITQIEVDSGDTLAGVLRRAGLDGAQTYQAVKAIEEHYDPRHIRPGQKLEVRFDPRDQAGSEYDFSSLVLEIDRLKSVSLTRNDEGGFVSDIEETEVVTRKRTGRAEIETSLSGSAAKAGIPASVIARTIQIYSWSVDFQRDIRRGDLVEVMYERTETPDGDLVRGGEVLYARLNVNGRDIPVYRFETRDGRIDYYTPEGNSIRRILMSTPIDGARLSSGFGMRRHPISGYNRMHRGLDFAAPTGTPIYAAGDGVVEKAAYWGAYGNYVRIRHNSTLKTAYAHLHNFARGITSGTRVTQGQVIGYVGTTGRSTGPHLHYEVHVNGEQVNPRGVDIPQGDQLEGTDLANFKRHVKQMREEYIALSDGRKYAGGAAASTSSHVR